MTLYYFFSALSGIFVLIGVITYIFAVIRGHTRPSKASWTIWTVLAVLTAGGMYQAHALNVQIAAVTIGNIIITVLAFKYGRSGLSTLDKLSYTGAGLGIVLWIITQNPLYVIVTSLAINGIGAVPTIQKAWYNPREESILGWTFIFLASLAQSFAIPAWTIANVLQPLVYLVIQSLILSLLLIPYVKKHKKDVTPHPIVS